MGENLLSETSSSFFNIKMFFFLLCGGFKKDPKETRERMSRKIRNKHNSRTTTAQGDTSGEVTGSLLFL
jgi:hypothetical protein